MSKQIDNGSLQYIKSVCPSCGHSIKHKRLTIYVWCKKCEVSFPNKR